MKISTNTNALAAAFGEEVAIKEIIKAGFDAIDISCFEMLNDDSCPKLSDNYKEYAKKLLSLTQGTGVYFNQAHAPFPSSKTDEEFNKKIYEKILRCMEFCSVLGVRNIVVHPLQHLKYADPDSPEILKEMNLEFYNSLIPYCRDYNIHVATENMWQYEDGKISHSVCSTAEEFKEYLDMLNSEWIVGCLDVGHANLVDADVPNFIRTLGDKLKALHIHDAGHNCDFHLAPYTINGEGFWNPIMKALADINYDGELTFEADSSVLRLPNELKKAETKRLETIGRYLVSKI